MLVDQPLSIRSLLRVFKRKMGTIWGLTLLETAMLAALPLLIGQAIDGLLGGAWGAFLWLMGASAGTATA